MSRVVSVRFSDEATGALDARVITDGAGDRSAWVRALVLRELGLAAGVSVTEPLPTGQPFKLDASGRGRLERPYGGS